MIPTLDRSETRENAHDARPLVEVFADGACKGNPGRGGWGAVVRSGVVERELFGGEQHSTNNRMKLTGVIRALQSLDRPSRVTIYTDSRYVHGGMSWIRGWKARNWLTADHHPVANEELWREFDAIASVHTINCVWVKGHDGHSGNERADALANLGVKSQVPGATGRDDQ